MSTQIKKLFAVAVVAVLYNFSCNTVYAQSKTPMAYWVTETLEVTNQAAFANAIKGVPPTVQAHGGRYIVLGGKIVPGIGSPPSRITIIAFDSLEQAQDWYNDPAAVAVRTEAQKYAKIRDYTVQGVAN
jgi:uncharacterized protein (DUF1330 family)